MPGSGVEEVAARFGVTPTVVRQRLKLAAVSPKLMALYREEDLTLDQLMAFTVSDDHAAQEAAWFDAPDFAAQPPRHPAAAHRRACARSRPTGASSSTVEAYRRPEGRVITDLFQSETEGYLADAALLDRLCAERLEREAEAVRQEGWKWVEILPEAAYEALRGYGRQQGKPQPMPAKQAKALAKVEAAREALAAKDELTDEEAEKLEALDAQAAALAEVPVAWSERQKKRCGAVVSLGYDGELEITRGLIAPADLKAERASPDETQDGGGEGASASAEPESAGLSKALRDDLVAQRTAALRAVVAGNTPVALAALAHALVLPLFYLGYAETALEVRGVSPALRGEGIDDNRGSKDMMARLADWHHRVPEQPEAVWDWLLTLDQPTLLDLLAYCAAAMVKPQVGPQMDQLAAAAKLDLAQWWAPTAKGYFSRVSKTLIAEAVREGVSAEAASNIASMKKQAMAEAAAQRLAGTGWLPELLRTAPVVERET